MRRGYPTTACTGSATSPRVRTTPACAPATAPRSWPPCATPPSTSSDSAARPTSPPPTATSATAPPTPSTPSAQPDGRLDVHPHQHIHDLAGALVYCRVTFSAAVIA